MKGVGVNGRTSGAGSSIANVAISPPLEISTNCLSSNSGKIDATCGVASGTEWFFGVVSEDISTADGEVYKSFRSRTKTEEHLVV